MSSLKYAKTTLDGHFKYLSFKPLTTIVRLLTSVKIKVALITELPSSRDPQPAAIGAGGVISGKTAAGGAGLCLLVIGSRFDEAGL